MKSIHYCSANQLKPLLPFCGRPFQVLSEDFGLFTWPSGVLLAYLIWARRREFRGVSVVEIGAGTALPGLLAAKVCEPRDPLWNRRLCFTGSTDTCCRQLVFVCMQNVRMSLQYIRPSSRNINTDQIFGPVSGLVEFDLSEVPYHFVRPPQSPFLGGLRASKPRPTTSASPSLTTTEFGGVNTFGYGTEAKLRHPCAATACLSLF